MYVIVTVIAIVVSIIAGIFANKRDRNVVPLTLTAFFYDININIISRYGRSNHTIFYYSRVNSC